MATGNDWMPRDEADDNDHDEIDIGHNNVDGRSGGGRGRRMHVYSDVLRRYLHYVCVQFTKITETIR